MIGCKVCPWSCADFVRNAQGQQRSGYRLLEAHYTVEHGGTPRYRGPARTMKRTKAARVDDRCVNCNGRGCQGCEPDGVVERWNFNTLERLPDQS